MTNQLPVGRVLDAEVFRAFFRMPIEDREGEPFVMTSDGSEPQPVPAFSTDDGAKGLLLERLKQDGILARTDSDEEGRWNCRLVKHDRQLSLSGYKETEAEAVVRAAMNFHHAVYGR